MSILGLPYIRVIAEKVTPETIERLVKKYYYFHLYLYQEISLPNFSKQTQTIGLIDLTQDEEAIFQKFKKNTRNEIRKSKKIRGLTSSTPDFNIKNSYAFYKKIKRGDGVTPDIRREFTGCLFFNAYLNQKLIVSISCYDTGQILRLKHVVSARKMTGLDPKIIGYASRRLIWEICRYGKDHSHRWFDLAGINLADAAKSGVAAFKQSFGVKLCTNYIYRYQKQPFSLMKKILRVFGYNIH